MSMETIGGGKMPSQQTTAEKHLEALKKYADGDSTELDALLKESIPSEVDQSPTFGEMMYEAQQGNVSEKVLEDLTEASENSFAAGYRTKGGFSQGVAETRSPEGKDDEAA